MCMSSFWPLFALLFALLLATPCLPLRSLAALLVGRDDLEVIEEGVPSLSTRLLLLLRRRLLGVMDFLRLVLVDCM